MRFQSDKYKSLSKAAALPGFDRMKDNTPNLYLGIRDLEFITGNIENIQIQKAPSMLLDFQMASTKDEVLNGTAYAGYDLYLEIMEYFMNTWPELCSIDTIGTSNLNRLILAARLEKQNAGEDHKPVLLYTSTIHGDETTGYSLMLMLINELLTRNEEESISSILENTIIYINPLENPDGTFFSSDETVYGATRGNYYGVDLNRNYPDPVKGDNPDGNSWQKETLAMMDFLDRIKPNLSANFHGGSEVVNYPFDSYQALHADDEWFQLVSWEYADTAMAIDPDYMSIWPGPVVKGTDWYTVYGGRQDYVTYFLRGRELTIELSNTKTISESLITEYWELNKSSLLNYIRQSNYGIRGFVTDSVSGEALEAELSISDYDKLNSSVFSDSGRDGFFVRYLKAGNYDLVFTKSGYEDYYLNDVVVEDYESLEFDVKMVPKSGPYSELSVDLSSEIYNPDILLSIENPEEQDMMVRIYDLQGRLIFKDTYWLEDGYQEVILKVSGKTKLFLIRLEFENETRFFKLLKLW